MNIEIYDEKINQNLDVSERKLLTSSSAFGILREQLVKNIGIERIKGFLFHYGWEMGVNDGKEALKTSEDTSYEYLIKYGPILHITNGHIRGIKHACTVNMDDDKTVLSVYGRGVWVDSYEAEEHIKRLGVSDTPVCHTLIGYASGYMSTIFGQPLLAKETTCIGRGDSECSWIIRPQKEWGINQENELQIFEETPIVKELEYTYEQLLEQQEFIMKLANFQNKLAEEVANGHDLQTITNRVYSHLHIPIIVVDIDLRPSTYSGLSEDIYTELNEEMIEFSKKDSLFNLTNRKNKSQLPFRKKVIRTENYELLITPILVQKEVFGYCAFVYKDAVKHKTEEDYMFLDRFSTAASLILLNEKTRFESFERMKGNFLDQILDAKMSANEIMNRGKYTGIDLGQAFHVIVMENKNNPVPMEEKFLLQEQILDTTFRYFNDKKKNILVSQREGKFILFITKDSVKETTIYDVIREFRSYLTQKYPKGDFLYGISNEGNDIKETAKHYEEASIALRLSSSKKIVSFHSLGIVGVLINSKNINGIKMMAEQELGILYKMKDLELLKTIYFFLLNGGKLEQTMSDLSLSMSGLRHRIKKIESLLHKDLRDPIITHHLFLILESLIAIGELDID